MTEYVPIFRLPHEKELEGWAEIIERDQERGLLGAEYRMNPFVFGRVRFLADPRDKVVGRLFRLANIRPEPPPLGETS